MTTVRHNAGLNRYELGSQLVREALDDARSRGFKIVPACSFVADFVRRHPQYADRA